jgi:hypothetical protein
MKLTSGRTHIRDSVASCKVIVGGIERIAWSLQGFEFSNSGRRY